MFCKPEKKKTKNKTHTQTTTGKIDIIIFLVNQSLSFGTDG